MEFEWDPEKAARNERVHGISFELALLVFEDSARIERLDDREDYAEERWVTTGLIEQREIVVIFTVRGRAIRLISARKAETDEREEYWKGR